MDYIRNKITELRLKRGVSEYQLSFDAGHGKNYIRNIVSGYSKISVKELLYLIEVLGVSTRDFFDETEDVKCPILVKQINDKIKNMPEEDLKVIIDMLDRLSAR